MSDPFVYDETKSELLAELVQQGLAMNVATSDSIEAPYGPADTVLTGRVELAETVGGAALADADLDEIEL